jgi:hypothetical protein
VAKLKLGRESKLLDAGDFGIVVGTKWCSSTVVVVQEMIYQIFYRIFMRNEVKEIKLWPGTALLFETKYSSLLARNQVSKLQLGIIRHSSKLCNGRNQGITAT